MTNTAKKHRIVLLDTHAILHRAYHALPDFAASSGEPTGALYGLATMLMKTIDELQPDELIAAYDLPEPTYRHEAYEDYKAGRPETDEALISQINRSREIYEAFAVPYYEAPGFEADDVLGTISTLLRERDDVEVIIASGDLDTLQLVSGTQVQVFTMRKSIKETVLYDETAVRERFGFAPGLLPDFKGLRGDPSDNIPGIPGIGEKTASTLLQQVGSLEEIYRQLQADPQQLRDAGITERVIGKLREHEDEAHFSKMLGTIRTDAPINFEMPQQPWRERVDVEQVLEVFGRYEFRSLGARIKAILSEQEQESERPSEADIDGQTLAETAIALWCIDSTITNPSLDDILQFARTNSFEQARQQIFDRLDRDGLRSVFEDIEKPIMPIVAGMEQRGIAIDTQCLADLSRQYHESLDAIAARIHDHAGREFNINSPKQLGEVLFDELQLGSSKGKRTAGGQRSTKESELEKLRGQHPIIEDVFEYRQLQKLLSTYIDTIPQLVSEDGRLHANFLQAGTTTGRMASANPNLQNIPIRTQQGRAIRNAFVASDGYQLAAFDYSQIELRIAAFLSGDAKLTAIFTEGGDVHAAVAAEVFDVARGDVDKEMRRKAKVINFGILYGMGVTALQQSLETSRQEAQTFLNAYFERFQGLADYIEQVKQTAAQQGFTETYYGRRRYIEGITSSVPYIRSSAERMAVNAPIQGTQADIIKIAMARIDARLREEGHGDAAHLLLQVHDELIYELHDEHAEACIGLIQETMESVLTPKETDGIALTTDISVGPSWGQFEAYSV